jgi:hypothetical protein
MIAVEGAAEMGEGYTIEPIGPRSIDKAYPLARVIAPRLLQLEWRQLCQSCDSSDAGDAGQGERIVVALNAKNYVKGLCVYAVRDHSTYGRVVDVPFLVAASAGDGEGVAAALVDFLRAKCDECVCSGIRFWTMDADSWARRSKPEHIASSDHGFFLPALASAAGIEKAIRACAINGAEVIDRLSR